MVDFTVSSQRDSLCVSADYAKGVRFFHFSFGDAVKGERERDNKTQHSFDFLIFRPFISSLANLESSLWLHGPSCSKRGLAALSRNNILFPSQFVRVIWVHLGLHIPLSS